MKAKLTKNGSFKICKKTQFISQFCIFNLGWTCNSLNCPAFREPEKMFNQIWIQLCREVGTLIFDEFEDERE